SHPRHLPSFPTRRSSDLQEVAVEVPVFTRMAIERAARYAFGLAERRRQRLVSVTKSNASRYAYVLWDEVVEEVARDFGGVELQRMHVDAMAARMVLRPDSIDVVVASNLFGDILTDLGGALQGSLGMCASANLNPERHHPSMLSRCMARRLTSPARERQTR